MADNDSLRAPLLACSAIENNVRRLDCVDELIGSLSSHPIAESIVVETTIPASSAPPIAEQSAPADTSESSIVSSDQELGQKYLRETQETTIETSQSFSLIGAHKDSKRRWVFEFDNGQAWRQVEARYLPHLKELPVQVSISEGVFGSNDLDVDEYGKSIKVKRLK